MDLSNLYVCAPAYLSTSKFGGKLLEKINSMNVSFDFILAIDFTEGLLFLSRINLFVFRDESYLQLSDISYLYEYFTEEMRRASVS